MAKKKNRLLIYLGATAVVLIIVLVAGKKAGWFGKGQEIKVSVEKVQSRTLLETVSASGKIQPEMEVKISSDVSGEIVGLFVKEGDEVKKGQLLVQIRRDVYESLLDRATAGLNNVKANLSNAEARFVQAEQAYNRNQKLHRDKVISDADFEQIKSSYMVAAADVEASKFNIKSAEASVKEARDNLSRTTIFAPADGTVSKLSVELGERVVGTTQMTGTEMLRIANLNSMEVSVDVNENDINRLSLGDTATIEIDAFIDKKFKGLVTEIANSANVVGSSADQVTNFTVKIRVLSESYAYLLTTGNKRSPFRPGLSATVDIQTERTENVLTIPIQAVTTRDDTVEVSIAEKYSKKKESSGAKDTKTQKSETNTAKELYEFVYVHEAGKVKLQRVKTGIQDDKYIQIVSGLKADQEVVTAPYIAISKTLKNGDVVKVVEESELFSSEEKK
jgi:HlyD family secretion protein